MTNQSKIRVLVIDDESSILESLVNFLEDSDFEVSSAETVADALELMEKTRPEVAIIDLRLREEGGDDLILHAHKLFPPMRFLIHTGSSQYKVSDELKRIGVSQEHVLFKPLKDLGEVVEAIEKLM